MVINSENPQNPDSIRRLNLARQIGGEFGSNPKVELVKVFGSTMNNKSHKDSDIDLAIIVQNRMSEDELNKLKQEARARALELGKDISVEIHLQFYDEATLKSHWLAPQAGYLPQSVMNDVARGETVYQREEKSKLKRRIAKWVNKFRNRTRK